MSAPVFIPFDFNPAATYEFSAISFSYTVPAGKYAIVTYSLCVSAAYRWVATTVIVANRDHTTGNNSHGGEIRLKAGDVLTRSVSAPSANFNSVSNEGRSVTATAELRVNGNAIAYVTTTAQLHTSSVANWTETTTATTHAHISEYNIAT